MDSISAANNECLISKSLDIIVPIGSPIFLDKINIRIGNRPDTNPCLPHYQKTDNPSKEVWDELCNKVFHSDPKLFDGSNGPNKSLRSLPNTKALWMNDDCPCVYSMIGREWSHVHEESDGSLHLVLSEADAYYVINTNWGERHLKAGMLGLPNGVIMVYAPRNSEEINIILDIMIASYKFCRGDFVPLRYFE